jgi:hypothetical protein
LTKARRRLHELGKERAVATQVLVPNETTSAGLERHAALRIQASVAGAVALIAAAIGFLVAARALPWFQVSAAKPFATQRSVGYAQLGHSLEFRDLGRELGLPLSTPSPLTRRWFESGLDAAFVVAVFAFGSAFSYDLRYKLGAMLGLCAFASWFGFTIINMHAFLARNGAVANPGAGAMCAGIGIVALAFAVFVGPLRPESDSR